MVDGDVQAGVADGVPRGGEPAGVAELGEDRDRRQRADAVVGHQRPAARLAASVGAQLARERLGLGVERVDDRERYRDLLARRRRLELLQPLALVGREQVASLRDAMVVEHGLDALLPLATLVDERVAQAHAGAEIEQVPRRDPRLRQPSDHQQLPQVPRVGAIGLGALLAARRLLVSAGSARCTSAPIACSSSTTNRQPVVASSATSSSWPANRPRNRRTPSRCAGVTRPRLISPVSVFSQSAVICARCWSSPITIVTGASSRSTVDYRHAMRA
jgi:hypothetical protein